MLNLALNLFVIAVAAGVLGFGGLAGSLAWLAKVFFFVFCTLFILSLLSRLVKKA